MSVYPGNSLHDKGQLAEEWRFLYINKKFRAYVSAHNFIDIRKGIQDVM